MSNFTEPGFWLLIAIVVLGVSQTIGAALARPHFRKLNKIAREVLDSPESNEGDKSWLQDALRDATNRLPLWLTALLAPVFGVYMVVEAVRTVMDDPTEREVDVEMDKLVRKNAELLSGVDPQTGTFWRDSRRAEATDAAFLGLLLSSPLLLLWLAIWILPAILIYLFGGAASVIWRSAIRTPLERASALSLVKVR
jgi:hypothetical protein